MIIEWRNIQVACGAGSAPSVRPYPPLVDLNQLVIYVILMLLLLPRENG